LVSSLIAGPEQDNENGRIRIVWANVASYTPIDPLTLTGEFTLAGAYKFTEMLLGRVEIRQDWADQSVFAKGANGADTNQTSLALQAIYTF